VKTLSLQEATILLQVHPETLRGWAKEGRAPGAKLGKSWLFIDTDLLDWVRSAYSSHTTLHVPLQA
jgi:excisionase family DNA binding protein